MTLSIAQKIIDGPWRHALRARAACRDGRWAQFVHETTPPGPLLIGRGDHAACVKRAIAMFSGPRDVTIRLFPVWVGDTPAEEPDASWWVVHADQIDGGVIGIVETGNYYGDANPALERAVTCKAKCWRVGSVVASRAYAPDIQLELRRGVFAVCAGEIFELESCEEEAGEPIPRPQIEVPAFSCWFEPRVTGLPEEVLRAIRVRSITTDDEGNLIERP